MRYWKPKPIAGRPLVGIGIASFLNEDPRRRHALESLWGSLRAQTYGRWLAHLCHDGPPSSEDVLPLLQNLARQEPRWSWEARERRLARFGHPWRQHTLEVLYRRSVDWVLLTNEDNWYAPVFLEWLLAEASAAGALLAYCDCVHSHRFWKWMPTRPRYRHLDLGGFLVHASVAQKTPFDRTEFHADGDWIDRLVAAIGVERTVKVPATLFVHN